MGLIKRLFFVYLALIALAVGAYGVSRRYVPARDAETLFTTYIGSLQSLDPPQIYNVPAGDIGGHVYECLYNYRYGGKPDEIFPQVAAGLPEISADGLTYTIRLRRGIRFYDPAGKVWPGKEGPALTARDVVFSWKRFADFHLAAGAYSSFFQGNIEGLDDFRKYTQSVAPVEVDYLREVTGLTAVDDHTVRVELLRPIPQFTLYLASLPTAITSEEAVRKVGNLKEVHIGTGPYAITEYLNDQRLVMEINPIYRGRPDVDGEGGKALSAAERLPTIKRIRWDYVQELLPAWHQFRQGLFDVGRIPKEAFREVVTPDKALRPEYQEMGTELRVYDDPGSYYMQFNMTDPVIGKNKPLRQAMSLAFDRDLFIRVYLSGRGRRATGVLPSDAPLFDPKYVGQWYRYDIEAAKAKVKEAEAVHGGPIPTIKLQMMDSDTEQRQYADFFKSQMALIGLKIEPVLESYDRWLEKLDQKNYQISWAGWAPDYPDEKTYLKLYDARLKEPPGSNSSGFDNPEFQAAMLKSEPMLRSPERDALYLKMRDIVDEELPSFTMFYPQVYGLRYKWVGNFEPPGQTSGFYAYRTLDIDARQAHQGKR